MLKISSKTSILISEFQNFYYELLKQKEKAFRMREVKIEVPLSAQDFQNNNQQEQSLKQSWYITEIQDFFYNFFQIKKKLLIQQNVGLNFVNDALYIMVTLTDEVFMNISWPGAKEWNNHTLEGRIFQTQIAGEQIFKKIETLLGSNDPLQKEISVIYMFSLGLGFLGKYRGYQDLEKISYYKKQLYSFIHNKPSNIISPSREKLFPQLYDLTITESSIKALPNLRTWFAWGISILLFYIFVSYGLWYKFSSEIHNDINQLFMQTRQGSSV